jgi:hypothetical protein
MYNLSKRLMIVLGACGLAALGIGAVGPLFWMLVLKCLIILQWLITTVNPPSLLSIDDQVYGPGGSDLIIPQCTDFVDPESYVFFFRLPNITSTDVLSVPSVR